MRVPSASGRSGKTSYDQGSEFSEHHFCHILLHRQVSKASSDLRGGAQTQPLHGRNVEECAALYTSSQPGNVLRYRILELENILRLEKPR